MTRILRMRCHCCHSIRSSIAAVSSLSKALLITVEQPGQQEAAGDAVVGEESVAIDARDALRCGRLDGQAARVALPAHMVAAKRDAQLQPAQNGRGECCRRRYTGWDRLGRAPGGRNNVT